MNKKDIREFYTKKIKEVDDKLSEEKDEKKRMALARLGDLYQGIMSREG